MAQQVLDVALVLPQVSKMILGAPRSCSGNITRRYRALQVERAQPLKKRHDLRLRCRKCVQNLCASWHDYPPKNQAERNDCVSPNVSRLLSLSVLRTMVFRSLIACK